MAVDGKAVLGQLASTSTDEHIMTISMHVILNLLLFLQDVFNIFRNSIIASFFCFIIFDNNYNKYIYDLLVNIIYLIYLRDKIINNQLK